MLRGENLDLVDGRLQHELCVRDLHRRSAAFVDQIFGDPKLRCSRWLQLLLECSVNLGNFWNYYSILMVEVSITRIDPKGFKRVQGLKCPTKLTVFR